MNRFFRRLENTENALRLTTVLLLVPMFFITDGRILCTTDTGAYLQTVSNLETHGLAAAIPMDRSVFFGLFLWAGKSYFGLAPLLNNVGIQLPSLALFQLMFLPFLLLLLGATHWLESLFTQRTAIVAAAALGIAMVFTSLPWFLFQAMPDVFTPLLFLYTMVFLHTKSTSGKILSGIIIVISALMHHSHLPLLLIFSLGLLYIKPLNQFALTRFSWQTKQLKHLFFLSLVPWTITLLLNLWAGNGPTPSKGSHVFLMGKLCENGLLKAYLEETPLETNPLAAKHPQIKVFYQHKNHLPQHAWDFVWNDQPLLGPTGGWHHGRELYLSIYAATLTSPKLLGMHLIAAIKATNEQLFLNHAGDGLEPLSNDGAVAIEMKKHFPKDYEGLFINPSPQQRSAINFGWFNHCYDIAAALLILITIVVIWKFPSPYQIPLLAITTYFVLCNAFITANLANVLSRLNARTFWLIPMVCAAIITAALIDLHKQKDQSTR